MSRQRVPEKSPIDDKRAKTGSSLRRNPIPAYRARLLAAQTRLLRHEGSVYRKACKVLFTKDELRVAAGMAAAARRERFVSDLKLRRNPAKRDSASKRIRRKLNSQLGRALPGFRPWQRLAREHARAHSKLSQPLFADSGEVSLDGPPLFPIGRTLKAPYTQFDQAVTGVTGVVSIDDQSIVVPGTGHMMNRFTFEHGPTGFGIFNVFQISRPFYATASVACGVSYTMPDEGRLIIRAELQNFASRIFWSVTDQSGWSGATLSVQQRIFVTVVRSDQQVIYRPKTLIMDGVANAGGNDHADLLPALDNSLPHVLFTITAETLRKSEIVKVLIGSEIFIESEVNDMRSHVDALVWWQLKSIQFGLR